MNKKEQAELLTAIADEMQTKPWYNPRLSLRVDGCCPIFCQAMNPFIAQGEGDAATKALGVRSIADWNDAHDTKESVISDLRERAGVLMAEYLAENAVDGTQEGGR